MKIYRYIAVILAALAFSSCGEEEYFNMDEIGGNGTEEPKVEVEMTGAVDLGLSVKWASCDLGANLPYVSGTEYKGTDIFKFGINNICGTEYDPATQALGDGWRMPSKQEIEEILADCKWKKTTFHNTDGWLVTGPSGRTIFMKDINKWSGTSQDNNHTIDVYMLILSNPYGYDYDPELLLMNYGNTCAIRPVKE